MRQRRVDERKDKPRVVHVDAHARHAVALGMDQSEGVRVLGPGKGLPTHGCGAQPLLERSELEGQVSWAESRGGIVPALGLPSSSGSPQLQPLGPAPSVLAFGYVGLADPRPASSCSELTVYGVPRAKHHEEVRMQSVRSHLRSRKGDPDSNVAPGTAFEALPDDYTCPDCGVGKDMYEPLG